MRLRVTNQNLIQNWWRQVELSHPTNLTLLEQTSQVSFSGQIQENMEKHSGNVVMQLKTIVHWCKQKKIHFLSGSKNHNFYKNCFLLMWETNFWLSDVLPGYLYHGAQSSTSSDISPMSEAKSLPRRGRNRWEKIFMVLIFVVLLRSYSGRIPILNGNIKFGKRLFCPLYFNSVNEVVRFKTGSEYFCVL